MTDDRSGERDSRRLTALDLDVLIHERVRLGIVSVLAVNESLSFTDMRDALGTTDGNLSVQARKLEEAGYIVAEKDYDERRPRTVYRLAPKGRRALERYIQVLEQVLPPHAAAERKGIESAAGRLSAAPSKA